MDACNLRSWKAQLKEMSIGTLTLFNFTATPRDPEFDLTLSEYRVGFTEGDTNEGYYTLNVDNLTVENLEDVQFMTEFLTGVYAAKFCLSWQSIPLVHHLRTESVRELDYDSQHAFQPFFGNCPTSPIANTSRTPISRLLEAAASLFAERLYVIDCPWIAFM